MGETAGTPKRSYFPAPHENTPPIIAVLIPCYNEDVTIADVVRQFRVHLPEADVYVFDNNSSDNSVAEAEGAGALVFHESRQGKGYVVQSMFRKVEADIYVIVDGDGTYPAEEVNALIDPIRRGDADMVIGSRLHRMASSEFSPLSHLGNRLFRMLLRSFFGVRLTDLLSGYRVFSKRLVRALPLLGGGFQTEAEMTIKALNRGFSVVELPVNLTRRAPGSHSKIRIVHDGLLILSTILTLFRDYKPLTFFGGLGVSLVILGCVPGTWVILDYVKTGLVPRLPSAVLAMGLILSGIILSLVGLILHTISRRFQELQLQLQSFAEESRRERPRHDLSEAAFRSGPRP